MANLEKPFGNCETLFGKFGRVEFIDCMNAMRKIDDNVFDLAFWDPPFNVNYGNKPFNRKGKNHPNLEHANRGPVILYSDDMYEDDYLKFLESVLSELMRVSSCVVVHPGYAKGNGEISNERLWFDNFPPDFTMTRLVSNPKDGGQNCYLRRRNPLLGYGKPPKQWKTDIFETVSLWGFIKDHEFVHPCPMNNDFLLRLVGECKAKFVYDPMCGSGALPEACEILGVVWYANEKELRFKDDVNFRILRGQSERKRKSVRVVPLSRKKDAKK